MMEVQKLPDKLHRRVLDWQKRHFRSYRYLLDNWSKFYKQDPFRLVAYYGPLKNETIEVGKHKGRRKFHKAAELDEEMLHTTAKIIKAQCSTELGSIQQHRESLAKATDPNVQFDVIRVMAEELRHAYQMLHLLGTDDWGSAGKRIADDTMDELLGMEPGGQVLDAFNVFFDSFVDNITFCAIIDRVGKYQLTMQQVFSYAPMARSMGPMLREEAFHLATGKNPLRRWAREAAQGAGNVTPENIQKHINKWSPRGLEMFGDERGGQKVVDFGFKDMANRRASDLYYEELQQEVMDAMNGEVMKARVPGISKQDGRAMAGRILSSRAPEKGVAPDDLFTRPARNFYRRRGVHAFEMNDVHGNPIQDSGEYLQYMRRVLPDSYVAGPDFRTYVAHLKEKLEGKEVEEKGLPFYG